jgi:hypothetical protein
MTWSERTRIELDDRVEATTRALRAAAVEAEMAISGDDRNGESCAARLLGLECETLAKKRSEGKALLSYRVPVGGACVSYRPSTWRRGSSNSEIFSAKSAPTATKPDEAS